MLTDLLVDVAETLEDALAPYGPDRVTVTPGEPAVPAGESCRAVWVWASGIFHSIEAPLDAGDEAGCFYRRTYQIHYRMDVCLPINSDGSDLSTSQYLAVSETIYGMGDAAWCALTYAASAETLFQTIGSCEEIAVRRLEITAPQGGYVSAEGTILVSDPCDPPGS